MENGQQDYLVAEVRALRAEVAGLRRDAAEAAASATSSDLAREVARVKVVREGLEAILSVFDGRAGRKALEDVKAAISEAERLRPKVIALAEACAAAEIARDEVRHRHALELRAAERDAAAREKREARQDAVLEQLMQLAPHLLAAKGAV